MKKIIAIVLLVCMIVSLSMPVSADHSPIVNDDSYMTLTQAQSRDDLICSLLEELDGIRFKETMSDEDLAREQELMAQLDSLGVEFVEVEESSTLSRNGYTDALPSTVPSTTYETWSQWTSSGVLYNGTRYDVTTLRAVPYKNINSKLYSSGTSSLHAAPMMELIYTTVLEYGVGLASPAAVMLIDGFNYVQEGMETNTIVTDVTASYAYGVQTYYYFRYVTPTGSAQAPTLCHVDNCVYANITAIVLSVNTKTVTNTNPISSDRQYQTGSNTINAIIQSHLNKSLYGITYSLVPSMTIYARNGSSQTPLTTVQIFPAYYPNMIF